MEIIADMDSGYKLVKVTLKELAIIQGFDSTYDPGFDKDSIKVGKIIDVAKFAKVSSNVKNLNTSYLNKIAANLDDAVIRVREAITMADEINCFEKLKDQP